VFVHGACAGADLGRDAPCQASPPGGIALEDDNCGLLLYIGGVKSLEIPIPVVVCTSEDRCTVRVAMAAKCVLETDDTDDEARYVYICML
jgi:hypothetical protein